MGWALFFQKGFAIRSCCPLPLKPAGCVSASAILLAAVLSLFRQDCVFRTAGLNST